MTDLERSWWITICRKCGELLDGTEPTDACQHDREAGTVEVVPIAAPDEQGNDDG